LEAASFCNIIESAGDEALAPRVPLLLRVLIRDAADGEESKPPLEVYTGVALADEGCDKILPELRAVCWEIQSKYNT
jgi:hypothetical protein